MNRETIDRLRDYAIKEGEKVIGLTMTFLALLTAGATLAGHIAHTNEVISTTMATDQWGFYQAKHIRSHMYGIEAEKAAADNKPDLAEKYLRISVYEQCGDHADHVCKNRIPLLKDSRDLQKLVNESPKLKKFFQEDDSIAGKPVQLPPCGEDDSQPPSPAGVVNAAEKTGSTPSRKEGAIDISNRAKNEALCVKLFKNRAYDYDWAEILLECSIMCCGIALLVGTQSEWKLAYLITLTGVLVAIGGVAFALRGWLLS